MAYAEEMASYQHQRNHGYRDRPQVPDNYGNRADGYQQQGAPRNDYANGNPYNGNGNYNGNYSRGYGNPQGGYQQQGNAQPSWRRERPVTRNPALKAKFQEFDSKCPQHLLDEVLQQARECRFGCIDFNGVTFVAFPFNPSFKNHLKDQYQAAFFQRLKLWAVEPQHREAVEADLEQLRQSAPPPRRNNYNNRGNYGNSGGYDRGNYSNGGGYGNNGSYGNQGYNNNYNYNRNNSGYSEGWN